MQSRQIIRAFSSSKKKSTRSENQQRPKKCETWKEFLLVEKEETLAALSTLKARENCWLSGKWRRKERTRKKIFQVQSNFARDKRVQRITLNYNCHSMFSAEILLLVGNYALHHIAYMIKRCFVMQRAQNEPQGSLLFIARRTRFDRELEEIRESWKCKSSVEAQLRRVVCYLLSSETANTFLSSSFYIAN